MVQRRSQENGFIRCEFFFCFYTVNHSSLLQLETSFGISRFCLQWSFSCLSNKRNKSSVVSIIDFYPISSSFPFGVSQDSFLVLFFLFCILVNTQKLFNHFSFRVNFMLMTPTSSLLFLNPMYYLLLFVFFSLLPKYSCVVILFLKLKPSNFDHTFFLTFFSHMIIHQTSHSPLFPSSGLFASLLTFLFFSYHN